MSVDTYSQIAPFLYFAYNMTNAQAQAASPRYDTVICPRPETNAVSFRNGNATSTIMNYTQYRCDNGSYLATGAGAGLAWWQANHPSWVLYKADQVTPAYSFGQTTNVPLDIQNPAVISWFVSQYAQPASQQSPTGTYTYMFADNVTLSNDDGARGAFKGAGGAWVQLYDGTNNELAYRQAMATWASNFRAQLQALTPSLKVTANVSWPASIPNNDPTLLSLISNIDAMMDEGGFSNFGSGNITGAAWVSRVQFMQTVQQTYNKGYYLVHMLPSDTPANRRYGLASYLMGKYHSASLYLVPMVSGSPDYGSEHYYDEYTTVAPIGSPVEDMTLDVGGAYRRVFTGGSVVVNPDPSTTYTYSYVGRTYTLPPVSALILTNFKYSAFTGHV